MTALLCRHRYQVTFVLKNPLVKAIGIKKSKKWMLIEIKCRCCQAASVCLGIRQCFYYASLTTLPLKYAILYLISALLLDSNLIYAWSCPRYQVLFNSNWQRSFLLVVESWRAGHVTTGWLGTYLEASQFLFVFCLFFFHFPPN